jgi:hypothetical protein
MIVKNNTSGALLAFGWHKQGGPGEEVIIPSGESIDVKGPYLGEMGGGSCYASVPGQVTCQENPDDDNGFQITKHTPLYLENQNDTDIGITIFLN